MRELANKKVLSLIVGLHTFFFVFLIFLVYESYTSSKENLLKEAYSKDSHIIKQEINFLSKQADAIYYLLITDRIKYILEMRDKRIARELLYEELKDKYQKIKTFFPIVHFQYRCYSFLRFYAKESFGDYLGDFRKSICYALKHHKPFKGFEVGKFGVFYRNVYPINNDYTVEFSVEFYKILKKLFKHSYILLNQKEINFNVQDFAYKAFGDFYSYKCHFPEKIDILKNITNGYFTYNVSKGIYIVIKYDDLALKELKKYYVKLLMFIISLYVSIFILIFIIYNYMQKKAEATHDPLTNLLNRNGCAARISEVGQYSMLIIDIDHFKKINDKYGHDKGDEVLKILAQTLRNSLRKTDIICRWGGEEFLVILPYTPFKDAIKVAQNLREKIKQTDFNGINITVSIGISEYVGDFDITFKIADENLYKAKNSGRDKIVY
ncbi:MAG: diguanylate cyclase [Epsilonproteobacteria bacterium]|nr:diguanylate cyclase [Campylobacterota bacterium]